MIIVHDAANYHRIKEINTSGHIVCGAGGHRRAVCVTNEPEELVVLDSDGVSQVLSLSSSPSCCAISVTDDLIAVAFRDGCSEMVCRCSHSGTVSAYHLGLNGPVLRFHSSRLHHHGDYATAISQVQFSVDGSQIVTVGHDERTVKVISAVDGESFL